MTCPGLGESHIELSQVFECHKIPEIYYAPKSLILMWEATGANLEIKLGEPV
jgi:hypothetical protein